MDFDDWLLKARTAFPGLTSANSAPTSSFDASYNCVAWAAGKQDRWWWPDPQGQSYWPHDLPRAVTLDAFVKAYGRLGYTEESDTTLESGKQKIAIFVDHQRRPSHASRQLFDGRWTSKLGEDIDIEHELAALEGPLYGDVAIVLARSTRAAH